MLETSSELRMFENEMKPFDIENTNYGLCEIVLDLWAILVQSNIAEILRGALAE